MPGRKTIATHPAKKGTSTGGCAQSPGKEILRANHVVLRIWGLAKQNASRFCLAVNGAHTKNHELTVHEFLFDFEVSKHHR
jgi:hypothetical protein